MDKNELARKLLAEMSIVESPGVSTNVGGAPTHTGRQEKLRNTWQDVMVQLEALFLDVLDLSEELYEECLQLLKDIRGSNHEMIHENVVRFKALVKILESHKGEGEVRLYIQRLNYLLEEVEWAADELAPKDDRVPEAPPMPKDQWKKDNGKKADVAPPDAVFEPAKGKNKGKTKTESALPPFCPSSLVMASLRRAADSVTESASHLEHTFLSAGDAVRLTLEAYTDIDSANVIIGESRPGAYPRLDVMVEWKVGTRPSDSIGTCSLFTECSEHFNGIIIEGHKNAGWVEFDENASDEVVAERIYECLHVETNPGARRVWSKARVVPSLYRLIERHQRGEHVPQYVFEEVLDGLRTRIGLHEDVGLVGDAVCLKRCDEALGADVWQYFYDWEYWHEGDPSYRDNVYGGSDASPVLRPEIGGEPTVNEKALTERNAKSAIMTALRLGFKGFVGNLSFSDLRAAYPLLPDFAALKSAAVALAGQGAFAFDGKGIITLMGKETFEESVDESALIAAYRTPYLRIDLAQNGIWIGEQKLDPETTDEDATAKLLTLSMQKEGIESGHIIEKDWEKELKTEIVGTDVQSAFEDDKIDEAWAGGFQDSLDEDRLTDVLVNVALSNDKRGKK
jgi:hypothetical protein